MLGFIPAKGTSKGLPGKNKRLLNGKPLVAYSIEAALASSLDRVFVSTDDEDIAAIAKNFGLAVPFLRPASLSGDTDTIEAALSYTLDSLFQKEGYTPKGIVLLQPTSPLRTTTHINEAIALFHSTPESVLSVSDPMEHPAEMVYWKDGKMNFCLESILPGKDQRQSYPHYYLRIGNSSPHPPLHNTPCHPFFKLIKHQFPLVPNQPRSWSQRLHLLKFKNGLTGLTRRNWPTSIRRHWQSTTLTAP